jgi:hypothetical protein
VTLNKISGEESQFVKSTKALEVSIELDEEHLESEGQSSDEGDTGSDEEITTQSSINLSSTSKNLDHVTCHTCHAEGWLLC